MIPRSVIDALCEAGGVDVNRVTSIDIEPHAATFHLLSHHDGRHYLTPNRDDVMRHWVRVPISWRTT